jgi:hypothetical protein
MVSSGVASLTKPYPEACAAKQRSHAAPAGTPSAQGDHAIIAWPGSPAAHVPVDREVFQNRPWGGGDPIGTNSATYSISRKKAASEASA